tara:strand:- start:89 stop:262 length:174 start_codon:yes stop_codon:yes gene_type:complete
MGNKLKSRKLWMSIISGVLLIMNEGLGIIVDTNTILSFSGIIMSYILGQSFVDGKNG